MRHVLSTFAAAALPAFALACSDPAEPSDPAATGADSGVDAPDTTGTGATSDCEVAFSCRTDTPEGTLNCIDSSERPADAKAACEGQSTGSLTYVYAESPCPRTQPVTGCLTRQGSSCRVAWVYGPDSSSAICRSQGHTVVTQ